MINNLRREGAQVQLFNQVTAPDNDEIRYSVFVRQPGGALAGELRQKGIEVIEPARYCGLLTIHRTVSLLRRHCLQNGIDVIHAHMADAAFLGWMVSRSLRLPLVVTHHGQDILLKCSPSCRLVYWLLLLLSARYAAINIAVSAAVAGQVKKLLRIEQSRLRVIANGVRLPPRSSLESDRRISSDEYPVIVNLGRLVPLKGQHQLVDAMVRLVEQMPGARLYIVGGGNLEAELKQQAVELRVDDRVEFTGMVDDVAKYLGQADIYVSSSRSEGMPISVLEAMAWRLPVVASDIPGHRSVISPGETGYLYRLDDVEDLAATMLAVSSDRHAAAEVAARARSMVERDYSAETCRRIHDDLYRQLHAGSA